MKRLTKRYSTHTSMMCKNCDRRLEDSCGTIECLGVASEALAKYEDTGLTDEQIQEAVDLFSENGADVPAQIESWVERCTWYVRKCNELRAEIDKYHALGTVEELSEMKFRLELLDK